MCGFPQLNFGTLLILGDFFFSLSELRFLSYSDLFFSFLDYFSYSRLLSSFCLVFLILKIPRVFFRSIEHQG